jgi:hypothetical protein
MISTRTSASINCSKAARASGCHAFGHEIDSMTRSFLMPSNSRHVGNRPRVKTDADEVWAAVQEAGQFEGYASITDLIEVATLRDGYPPAPACDPARGRSVAGRSPGLSGPPPSNPAGSSWNSEWMARRSPGWQRQGPGRDSRTLGRKP